MGSREKKKIIEKLHEPRETRNAGKNEKLEAPQARGSGGGEALHHALVAVGSSAVIQPREKHKGRTSFFVERSGCSAFDVPHTHRHDNPPSRAHVHTSRTPQPTKKFCWTRNNRRRRHSFFFFFFLQVGSIEEEGNERQTVNAAHAAAQPHQSRRRQRETITTRQDAEEIVGFQI